LDQFTQSAEAFNQYLNAEVHFSFDNGEIIMQVLTGELPKMIEYEKPIRLKGELTLLIGMSRQGILSVALNKDAPHILVAGYTNSGKSTFLRAMIVNLILTHSYKTIRLHLIDLKGGLEFNIFKDSYFVDDFVYTIEQAKEVLKKIYDEMEIRKALFREVGVFNIDSYNKSYGKLTRHIIIIDEFPNLGRDKQAADILDQLLMQARSQGIHIIACLQDPRAQNMPGELKGNFGATVALKVRGRTQSQIILDNDRASKLRGNGHGILRVVDDIEFQGYFLDENKTKEFIRRTIRPTIKEDDNTGGVIPYADYREGPGDN
jgi:S-DNA-T family DNA segregation ATPase FtsK/SpoIIIE